MKIIFKMLPFVHSLHKTTA